jgi:hypothetical protein
LSGYDRAEVRIVGYHPPKRLQPVPSTCHVFCDKHLSVMKPQTLPTVRVFAPEQWGEVDRFANFYEGTYKFSDRDQRAVSGVANHFEKALTLQSLAVKLRPGLDIDHDQLNKNGFTPALNSHELSAVSKRQS